jgi:O-antigen ligase
MSTHRLSGAALLPWLFSVLFALAALSWWIAPYPRSTPATPLAQFEGNLFPVAAELGVWPGDGHVSGTGRCVVLGVAPNNAITRPTLPAMKGDAAYVFFGELHAGPEFDQELSLEVRISDSVALHRHHLTLNERGEFEFRFTSSAGVGGTFYVTLANFSATNTAVCASTLDLRILKPVSGQPPDQSTWMLILLVASAVSGYLGYRRDEPRRSDLVTRLMRRVSMPGLSVAVAATAATAVAFEAFRCFVLETGGRCSGTAGTPVASAHYVALLALVLVKTWRATGALSRTGLIVMLSVCVVALVATQSRGVWLMLIAAITALSPSFSGGIARGAVPGFARVVLLVVGTSLLVAVPLFISTVRNLPSQNPSSYSRPEIWGAGLAAIAERPLFGYGQHSSALALGENLPRTAHTYPQHSHNLFVEAALWYGVPFSLMMLAALITCLALTWSRPWLRVSLVVLVVSQLYDFTLLVPTTYVPLSVLIFLATQDPRRRSREDSTVDSLQWRP